MVKSRAILGQRRARCTAPGRSGDGRSSKNGCQRVKVVKCGHVFGLSMRVFCSPWPLTMSAVVRSELRYRLSCRA